MALNYFLGWAKKDLEAALRLAQEDLAAGKDTTSAGAGDAHVSSKIEMTPQARIEMILKALNVLDPETYPIDQITAIRQARVAFSAPTPRDDC